MRNIFFTRNREEEERESLAGRHIGRPLHGSLTPHQGGVSGGSSTGTFNAVAPYPLTSIGIDLGLVSSRLGTCTISTPLS